MCDKSPGSLVVAGTFFLKNRRREIRVRYLQWLNRNVRRLDKKMLSREPLVTRPRRHPECAPPVIPSPPTQSSPSDPPQSFPSACIGNPLLYTPQGISIGQSDAL